jgi:hypothetical protein
MMRVRHRSAGARASAALFALLVALAFERTAHAQGFYWSVQYDVSLPVGSVRSFVPAVSPIGFVLDARYWFAGPNLSVGVAGIYNQFYHQSPQATYPVDNGAVTATLYRIADVTAIAPEAHYYFGPANAVVPYLGAGAGFASVKFHVLVSDLDVVQRSSGFIMFSEGGILIPFDRDGFILQAVMLGARATFISAGFRDVDDTSYISLTLGALIY